MATHGTARPDDGSHSDGSGTDRSGNDRSGTDRSGDGLVGGADAFAERALSIIDEGRRTSTYKLALLLALIDHVAAHPPIDDDRPVIPTQALAAQVLRIYFPQARAYLGGDFLRQSTNTNTVIVAHALQARIAADACGARTIDELAQRSPTRYDALTTEVEKVLVRYPIPLLQVVGATEVPFLYESTWDQGQSLTALRRDGTAFITLLPGVAGQLIRFGPLLRPLIEHHWVSDVAKWSKIDVESDSLHRHLFGADRRQFPTGFRRRLVELQHGSCFYCGKRLSARVDVDHFIPWSRWPNDSVQNLVAADHCNGAKSDHIAAPRHLDRWAQRNRDLSTELGDAAAEFGIGDDAPRSTGLARSTYEHLRNGTPLWVLDKEFTIATGPILLHTP